MKTKIWWEPYIPQLTQIAIERDLDMANEQHFQLVILRFLTIASLNLN